ncbi:hypothetical protein TNCV_4009551 [Trichonephila clavipes]|nr:hypothetical protein TNCV_4009551 [Trichonephila clavipes]
MTRLKNRYPPKTNRRRITPYENFIPETRVLGNINIGTGDSHLGRHGNGDDGCGGCEAHVPAEGGESVD